ncbi:PREDICTED: 101 kDa malaria antigen-like [Ipomoea nil]|uniref:101 kDa malaria antigen-like n=1 Tax=Ipomoea nil TaxID=35883 RepID=UPI00090168CC|nr:PREDICTED: 101 kDa malaria antigen-like [Ipomoea nil]
MQDKEDFALKWVGTDDVYKALRLEEINRVFSYKMSNRTLGRDKAPICIELNKPPLDPALEEEMKQLRYAMLLSKIKTTLEKEHQNDPNCNVSSTKDEHGREIEEDESDMNEDEDEDDNDDDDADDEHDDSDDDDDNDDQLGNVGVQEADPEDSDPILIGPDYDTFPQRSPLRKLPFDSDNPKEASNEHLEDLSRAIVPLVLPMDETPIKQEKESVREGKLEASPILLSSASGGKREALHQDEKMDTTPTNIEEESTAESPRTITNLMRETVHSAETIHLQYLALRQKDTKVLDDLCKKVDLLMAAQSQPQPPPQEQPQPSQQAQSDHKFLERIAKRLHELDTTMNKVARQQHELKHSHFGLKEHVDLAFNKVSSVPPTTCADDAKKGEKRNDDKDRDDDHPRDPRDNTKDQSPEARHSPSRTPRDSGRRNTNPSHPPSRSRGHHSSKPRSMVDTNPDQLSLANLLVLKPSTSSRVCPRENRQN